MSKANFKFPPNGFWLSPKGAVLPIQVHAELLTILPKAFKLKKTPHGRDEINEAMADVIYRGWIRGRVLSPGTISFQVQKASQATIGTIYDFLLEYPGGISHVVIEPIEPKGYWEFTLRDFFDSKYPSLWQLNPRRNK